MKKAESEAMKIVVEAALKAEPFRPFMLKREDGQWVDVPTAGHGVGLDLANIVFVEYRSQS